MTAEAAALPAVHGPAAPAYSDLIWATGTTAAAMADPAATLAQREAAAEAEQAAYVAARHLGVADPEPGVYARELELAGLEPKAGW